MRAGFLNFRKGLQMEKDKARMNVTIVHWTRGTEFSVNSQFPIHIAGSIHSLAMSTEKA